jgi:hypothetical protein
MSNTTPNNVGDKKNNTLQTWIVSLAVSIFCCALFFVFASTYINTLNVTLSKIDERLADIEKNQVTALPPVMPSAESEPLGPFPTVIPPSTSPEVNAAPPAGAVIDAPQLPTPPSVPDIAPSVDVAPTQDAPTQKE